MSATVTPNSAHDLRKNGKRSTQIDIENGPPPKKRRQLLELEISSEEESIDGDDDCKQPGDEVFHVNEEFAKRFEYNKKREELTKLQAKYGGSVPALAAKDPQRALGAILNESSSGSSSDEDEDDDGELALGALDEEVQNTLEAIRNKDPRVYDADAKFYTDHEEGNASRNDRKDKKEEPMYISDYHRKNLLEGRAEAEDDNENLLTWQEQQDDLKSSIVKEMHTAIEDPASEDDEHIDSIADGFLVKKAPLAPSAAIGTASAHRLIPLDVALAEKNPEAYLTEFISTRAWVSKENTNFHPFESDDEEEEHRAEAFEEAYNLRFEDPNASNEKLMSHARDTAARYSVRKDGLNSRKKKRDIERSHKDAEKQLRREEKARLRKLRVAELEGKIKLVKEAAGLENANLPEESWSELLDDAWDDQKWDLAMGTRFGDDYYNDKNLDGEANGPNSRNERLKKPKWKDEININDIVADFRDDEAGMNPTHTTEDDAEFERREEENTEKTNLISVRERRKLERLERQKIEEVVDGHLAIDESLAKPGKKHAGYFRYRETSPLSHGLTAHDILMADDGQLNQFAGLKKLAAFRDPDKKRKDKKNLGKKQRLRQWRKETFGHESGPTKTLADILAGQVQVPDEAPRRRLRAEKDRARTSSKNRKPSNATA